MNVKDLYIDFFLKHGHKQIPSAPVVPENDPSVLFNTAGMQPLIPYLMGQKHPYGTRLCDYQKCIRTNDLDEVGDTTHHTFFEMLGNWSLGDYFKEESITWSFEFLTSVLKIPLEKLGVTVFSGNDSIPFDKESYEKWLSLGIKKERIAILEDNFWIAGESGPCGGDTEIFYFRSDEEVPQEFDPEDDRWVEIWNNVFMEYFKEQNGAVKELPNKNVDTGMGLERITSVLEGVNDNYVSSIWKDVINLIEEISKLPYKGNEQSMRIIADHLRTAVFISADPAGIKPSNTDQGYILRRLIRRAIRHAKKLNIDIFSNWEEQIAKLLIEKYKKYYKELEENEKVVLEVLKTEKEKFNKTLEKGLKEFKRVSDKDIDATTAFHLYDTYGFPIELTKELANELNIGYEEKDMYSKIEYANEFYNLYNSLIEKAKWEPVEKDLIIKQPIEAQKGEQYVVLLKKVAQDGTETYDAKFMTSYREDEEEKIPGKTETKIVQETAKLPITGDSIILFAILAVIVLALILIFVRMKKLQNKEEKH